MRCRKCGIQIPSGTLCDDCYNETMEEKYAEKDNNLLLKLTRKFLPSYELMQNFEWILLCVIMIIVSLFARSIGTAIAAIIVIGGLVGINMIFKKRIAVGTKCYFYETKVVYTYNFLFIHRKKVLKYTEIKDIGYNQNWLQKKFGLGVIFIFSKKSGFVFNGIRINDIANVKETFSKIAQLVGNKIN